MKRTETKLPVAELNENLRAIGRDLTNAHIDELLWRGDELGLVVVWADGARAWVGFGEIASALVQARFAGPAH